MHIPSVKFLILILTKFIAKTLHILSIQLKNLGGQDVQTGIVWILQLSQFKRLERPFCKGDSFCIFFQNNGVEFINIARILHGPDIVKSLPSSPVKFPIPVVTYRMIPLRSTKLFSFNKIVINLDLDLFLSNPDSLQCKCNNSAIADRYHKHTVTGDLRIIRNNVLRKLFSKGPKYKKVRPIHLERVKGCILEGLDNCILSWCYENSFDKSFFSELTKIVKIKFDERMSHLANK